jgi:uncharacterized membrane protein YvbJ
MKCPKCGTENPAGKIVCRNCGTRLRVQPGNQAAVRWTDAELMSWVRADVRRLLIVSAIVIAGGIAVGLALR